MEKKYTTHGPKALCTVLLTLLTVSWGSLAGGVDDGTVDKPQSLPHQETIRGWTILSESEEDAMAVIAAAPEYNINHLQISHSIVHDLMEVRDSQKRALTNRLTRAAHDAGIGEVVVWDHALYDLDYYPERFRTGPSGTLDLDNSDFWEWFKADYREMLDLVPEIDGIILTFIETGARVEEQHSSRWKTNSEKLAAVVNAVAEVVIGERGLAFYARTFAYTHSEYENIVGAIEGFAWPEIRLMMKETPHDFFLTHPNDFIAGTIPRSTIIEFDACGEFNGQGIIANTWPEYILRRGRDLLKRDHVIGYVARTDRYGDTRLVGRPGEINLYALKRLVDDFDVTAETVYDEFIAQNYGEAAAPYVKPAFKAAYDVVSSSLYTLGTNVANHSKINYEPYRSSYARHVSGKWFDPPVVYVGHGVDREFHYWKDVVEHIAPAWAKAPTGAHWKEVPWVLEQDWVTPKERMNEEFLRYIIKEKDFGVARAQEALSWIEKAKPHLSKNDYRELHHYFARTLLTTRLYRAVAAAYFGFRVYCRGEEFRSDYVLEVTENGLRETTKVADLIRNYPVMPPVGQWDWKSDADAADEYVRLITVDGWPETTRAFANPNGGMTYPFPRSQASR